MKKTVISLLFLLLTFGVFFFGGALALAASSPCVNTDIGPPPIVAAAPTAMVVVPHSSVYFVPEPGIDIFFYSGYWWSPRGDRWYRSLNYNYGWAAVNPAVIPQAVIYVPRDYRVRYANERHIPYGHWRGNHAQWERERMESHRRWEREREIEWRRQGRHERYDAYGYNYRDTRYDNRGGGYSNKPSYGRGPAYPGQGDRHGGYGDRRGGGHGPGPPHGKR